jgi:hypothetical protein
MTGFIVSVFPFRNRVSSKEAFEGLELGEGKLSRPVLRGPGGCKAAWLLGSNASRTSRDNALALTKPPPFAYIEIGLVDCWERFGKELKVSKHQVNHTESTGHMFLVRAHNPLKRDR